LQLSYFEVYNEKIFDLFTTQPSQEIVIREEKDGKFTTPELKKISVNSIE